ncbi:MAG: AAA family ATPase [Anaerolineae bacterium]|nr:AAA family ATPase [Anaerolineae bacterium]
MRCGQCGFQNPEGFSFCGQCGAPLRTVGAYLSQSDLDHLRAYLPRVLVEALQLDLLSPSPELLEQCISALSDLLEALCALLPAPLIEQVAAYPRAGEVGGSFVQGTLLFADISGFTAMSERFNRLGQEGAEEIIAVVNRYFGAMLAILSAHDGQLIQFDGDALLGFFAEPNSVTRAVQAAQRMQSDMADFTETQTSQGFFPLQIKIGLHRGRFFAARLGTPRRMVYALFGGDVNAAAATEEAALAGQVLIDRETAGAIDVACQVAPAAQSERHLLVEQIEPISAPLHASPAPQWVRFVPDLTLAGLRQLVDLLDALTPYVPVGLLPRFVGDGHAGRLEGEHRLVSVMFVGIEGLDAVVDGLGPGREGAIVRTLNEYVVAVQEAVHRYGGVINKMDLAARGAKLLAFFGAPVAHENDAERAVRAAIAIQQRFEQQGRELAAGAGRPDLQFDQRVVVSYGYVFAGNIGTDWRREYTVMGDEVNLAERLLAVTEPGGLTVTDSVRRRVQGLFDLQTRGEVLVRGKSDPVATFAVQGLRAVGRSRRGLQGMRSPMVGRGREWRQLNDAIARAQRGRGQIVSLVGEAGLGKSRLIAELRDHVADGAVRWLEGRCLAYTEPISYWPIQEILRQMLGVAGDEDEPSGQELRQALESTPSVPDASAVLPYVAGFLGLPVQEWLQERVRYLDPEALQRRTFIALSTLFEVYARSGDAPLLVVLEDVHWIDQASAALLQHLLPIVDRVPLVFVLTYRPEQDTRWWQIGQEMGQRFASHWTEVELQPLKLADSQQLLANLVDLDSWPDKMRDLVLSRAEGNPLYLEELLRALIDDRVLAQDADGQWRLAARVEHLRVPDTLQGVIMTRLDRLDESSRWTAQVASVIGRVVSLKLLRRIVPLSEAQLRANLSQLEEHEIIRSSQRAPKVYVFNHVLVQDVCYRSLLARTRRLYHCRIAESLSAEGSTGPDTGSSYPYIAYHAFMGQDWPRAMRYQLLAGQHAQDLFANEAAIEHYRKVLQSADHLPAAETVAERRAAIASLGELLTSTAQYKEAHSYLVRAREMAAESQDREAEARACRWLGQLYELRSEYTTGLECIEEGLAVLAGDETVETTQLLLTAGLINTRLGNYDAALDQCEIGLRIAEQLDQVAVLARGYTLLGHLCRLRGVGAVAAWYFQRGLDLYEIAGDINGQAIAHDLLATAYFHTGQWEDAEREYLQAREMSVLIGNRYTTALADNNLGGVALNQGRLDEALDYYERALHALEQMGESLYVQGALHVNLGHTHIRRGQVKLAVPHLRTAEAYFAQARARDWLPEMYRHFAEAALLSQQVEEAKSHAQRALGLARELSMRNEEGNSLRVLARAALAAGQHERAEQYLDESLAILDQAGDEYEWARSLLVLGQLRCASGDTARCQDVLARCEPVLTRLGARLEIAELRALRERAAARAAQTKNST